MLRRRSRSTHDNHGAPRLAAWSVRHPWRALLAWLVIVVVLVAGGITTGTKLVEDGQDGSGDSGRAEQIITDANFPDDLAEERALVRRRDGAELSVADLAAVRRDLVAQLAEVPTAGKLSDPILSTDQRAGVVTWDVSGDPATAADRVAPMLAAVATAQAKHPELRVEQIGDGSIEKALDDTLGDDFKKAEFLSLPITLAILIVVFGALVAASLPLILALTSIIAAFGAASMVSQLVPQTENLQSILLIVGIAVGVDYALFMVRRARDERGHGMSVRDSVLVASATSGRAVLISGLTVIVAMAGMFLTGDATFTSLGVGAVVVVGVAVVGSLLALPALLVVLGDKVDRARVPFLWRLRGSGESRFWGAVVRRVVRRPGLAFGLSAGLLVLVALPALGMQTKLTDANDLPRSIPIMTTYDALTAAFPSEGGSHVVAISAPDVTTPQISAAIDDLERQATQTGLFTLPETPDIRISPDRTAATIVLPFGDQGIAEESLTALRSGLVPATVGGVADAHVTGETAGSRDFTNLVSSRLPIVAAFVVALTLLLMLASFRSMSVAVATVLLNVLSVAAAYGLLVLVFQNDRFDGLLGVETNGAIVAWLPLFLFVILFGLSMDYHVFVLSRIREAVNAGATPSDAIEIGVRKTSGVVTSAAVVMIAAFGIFATLSTIDMKQLGVGLAAAIAIDATIVRGVLLPAALRLLGERAWTESRIASRLPLLGHERPASAK